MNVQAQGMLQRDLQNEQRELAGEILAEYADPQGLISRFLGLNDGLAGGFLPTGDGSSDGLSVPDWLAALGGEGPFIIELPPAAIQLSTFDRRDEKLAQRFGEYGLVSPDSRWGRAFVRFVADCLDDGLEVAFRLASSSTWLRVQSARVGAPAVRDGLTVNRRALRRLVERLRPTSSPFDGYRVPAWSRGATHIVPAGEHGPRQAFALGDEQEIELHRLLAEQHPSVQVPWVEKKPAMVKLFFDVDLDWELLQLWPWIKAFKEAQFAAIAGKRDAPRYEGLAALVAQMVEGHDVGPVLVASRDSSDDRSAGHHVIFRDLVIRRERAHGSTVAVLVERAVAAELARQGEHEGIRPLGLLLRRLLTPSRILRPPVFELSETKFNSDINHLSSGETLQSYLLRSVRLSGQVRALGVDEGQRESLIRYCTESAGGDEFLAWNARTVGSSRSQEELRQRLGSVVGRMSWELSRRLSFFDHSVYLDWMGLRMLGSPKDARKPRRYQRLDSDEVAGPADISEFSIRPKRHSQASSLTPVMHYLIGLRAEPPFQTLRGMFNGSGLRETSTITVDQAYIAVGRRPLDLRTLPASERPENPLQATELLRSTKIVMRNGTPTLIERRATEIGVSRAFVRSPGIEIKIRIYIPSGLVIALPGPYIYAGDDRGPSYSSGDSRLDIAFVVVPGSNVFPTFKFGESRAYNHTDGYRVPGKPFWWGRLRKPTAPLLRARLKNVRGRAARARSRVRGAGVTEVQVIVNARNPLMPAAPPIDANLIFEVSPTGAVAVRGSHDEFPSWDIYVNGQHAYAHSPEDTGDTPLSLFGTGDRVERVEIAGPGGVVRETHHPWARGATEGHSRTATATVSVTVETPPEQTRDRSGSTSRDYDESGVSSDEADLAKYDRADEDWDTPAETGGIDESSSQGNIPETEQSSYASEAAAVLDSANEDAGYVGSEVYDIEHNADGTVTTTSGHGSETWEYDDGTWYGDSGSRLSADEDFFDGNSGELHHYEDGTTVIENEDGEGIVVDNRANVGAGGGGGKSGGGDTQTDDKTGGGEGPGG